MTTRAHGRSPFALGLLLIAYAGVAADRPVVVPMKLRGNFPVVTATIDGTDVPLQFDSGSPATVSLTQAVISRIHAIPTGEISRGVDAKGNVIEFPRFKIHRIQIGAAVFDDVVGELDVHDASYQATQVGQQGFLGTALLKGYKVVLDYRQRRMILIPPGFATDRSGGCTGSVVAFAPQWHGEPATEVDIDLGRLVVWWDTGSPTSVLSTRFVREAHRQASDDTLLSKRLVIGGTDFGPLQLEVADLVLPPGVDGFIGYNFFAKHVVCLDFPGNRLLIRR